MGSPAGKKHGTTSSSLTTKRARVAQTGNKHHEWLDRRLVIVVILQCAVFALCLLMPQLVLTPFLFAPVLIAVAFASPRAVTVLGVIAFLMAMYAGWLGITFSTGMAIYVRAPAMAFIIAIAVILARQRASREEQLHQLSLRDPLTGLANRTLLLEMLETALKQRQGRSPLSVLYIDLDDFKFINDQFGHEAGDQVLVEVARRVRESVRAGDTVARIGGDEFVALCPSAGNLAGATVVSQRILDRLSEEFEIDGQRVSIAGCVGVACGAGEPMSASEVLRAADQALYQAKSAGPARFAISDLEISGKSL